MANKKTVVVTGASGGIGGAVVEAFLGRGYNVVGSSRGGSGMGYPASPNFVSADGDVGDEATAVKVVKAAIDAFGSLDHVVHCAGIYVPKRFTDYTADDFRALVSTNLEGYVYITQRAVKRMLEQAGGGSVTCISASLADNPMVDTPSAVAMMTKGGLNAMTRSLANEYAKDHIRFNAVAPGVVRTPLHGDIPKDAVNTRAPMGTFSEAKDIAAGVIYLTEAEHVTGEVLHVDDGAHVGRW
jgi:NAD(P)-dependent dehydrogenase (short-subunit alcohol dehydrogenase family)